MTLIKYNPTRRGLVRDPFVSLFDKFFYDTLEDSSVNRFLPNANILEHEKNYEVQLAAPGMKKEDFSINLEDGKLVISGERNNVEAAGVNVHRQEILYGSFNRVFQLPEDIDDNKISASYTDGILRIEIPKDVKKTLKQKITIK